MHCINHPGTDAQSYCQNCGKPLCATCVRTTPAGQVFCESCLAVAGSGAAQPFYPVAPRGPNPSAAAVLGLIPGVGAMYNGQLFKGLVHVIVFFILVSITQRFGPAGIFIAAWCLYQSFEAYHTARALALGQPIPDPFGLNELGNWLHLGATARFNGAGQPPTPPPGGPAQSSAQPNPPPYGAGYEAGYGTGYGPGASPPYAEPYTGTEPYAQNYPGYPPGPSLDPNAPIPPAPPYNWRRREPVFAFVLIGLGIIFLLHSLGFMDNVTHYLWPIMLIGLGIWLIVRRVGWPQGGSQ